jgi:hypothetical protein
MAVAAALDQAAPASDGLCQRRHGGQRRRDPRYVRPRNRRQHGKHGHAAEQETEVAERPDEMAAFHQAAEGERTDQPADHDKANLRRGSWTR